MKSLSSVLIADVIHSRSQPRLRALLAEKLRQANTAHLRAGRLRLPYGVTAGDEFQGIPARIDLVPEIIFDLRRFLHPLSLRIAVGIGRIPGRIQRPVNRLDGEAFALARQAMDSLKRGRLHRYPALTAFRSPRQSFDRLANMVYGLNDTLLLGITETQWRTLNAYMRKRRVDRTARLLGVDESTASRNLRRARYWQLAEVADAMNSVLHAEWF